MRNPKTIIEKYFIRKQKQRNEQLARNLTAPLKINFYFQSTLIPNKSPKIDDTPTNERSHLWTPKSKNPNG